MMLRKLLRRLRQALAYHDPLITITISKERLLGNYRAYRERYAGYGIAPMLKSNAYGHGLRLVAELLDNHGVAFFAVDSLYEARELRKGGIRSRIVVMGYVRPEYIADSSVAKTDYAITDIEQLRALASYAHKGVRIHLKLDTGMHRQGIVASDVEDSIRIIRSNSHLRLVGICSHLADADNPDTSFAKEQLGLWHDMRTKFEHSFNTIEYKHISATKGARFADLDEMNVLRIGMGMMGYDTSPHADLPLRPVLSMESIVTSIRDVPVGDSVGYNATWIARRPSVIATVPVGYYEGVDRRLSNKGVFRIDDHDCPIAGRVSMNMTSIDITDRPDITRESVVSVISNDPDAPNSVRAMAQIAETTPYVIFAHLPHHLRRVVK